MARQDDYVRHTVRIPRAIYDRISAMPGEGSVNAKIVDALDASSINMTLRDYFAAQALAAIIAADGIQYAGNSKSWDQHAAMAYAHADAMLKARAINLGEAVKAEAA